METILNNGFFWGLLAIAFAAIVGYIGNRYAKTEEKVN